MPILIRDPLFEQKIAREGRLRGHKSQTKTITELANERLTELAVGQFIPGERIDGNVEQSLVQPHAESTAA